MIKLPISLQPYPLVGNWIAIVSWILSINPYWQISGIFPRPFYWKTHPSKNHEYSVFKKSGRHLDRFTEKLIQSSNGEFWGVIQAVLLENSSKRKYLAENNISPILGRHTDRFTGKLIQTIFQSFLIF